MGKNLNLFYTKSIILEQIKFSFQAKVQLFNCRNTKVFPDQDEAMAWSTLPPDLGALDPCAKLRFLGAW